MRPKAHHRPARALWASQARRLGEASREVASVAASGGECPIAENTVKFKKKAEWAVLGLDRLTPVLAAAAEGWKFHAALLVVRTPPNAVAHPLSAVWRPRRRSIYRRIFLR